MIPKFKWVGDGPDVASGTAHWNYHTQGVKGSIPTHLQQRFNTFNEAHEMHHLIEISWKQGKADGVASVVKGVSSLLLQFEN